MNPTWALTRWIAASVRGLATGDGEASGDGVAVAIGDCVAMGLGAGDVLATPAWHETRQKMLAVAAATVGAIDRLVVNQLRLRIACMG
jgi:hypothetical protein